MNFPPRLNGWLARAGEEVQLAFLSRKLFGMAAVSTLCIVFLLTFSSKAFGQPSYDWAEVLNSATNDKGYAVTTDANGNVYLTGSFTGTMAVGASNLTCPSYSTSGCVFLAKFTSSGTAQWATSFNNDYGAGSAVATDSSGNVFVAGSATDADFGCGAGIQSGSIFVAKLAPSGSCLWAKPFVSVATAGTTYSGGQDALNGLAVDNSGNVLITGKFGCTTNQGCAINFGGGLITSNQQPSYGGVFVTKLSGSNGNWLWSDAYGGVSGQDIATGVAVDSSSNVFITGYFSSNPLNLGGSNLANLGSTNFFIAKYGGSNGAPTWSEGLGSASLAYAMGIAVDSGEDAVVTGQFQGTVNFGVASLTSASLSYPEVFLARYANSNGANLWAKAFGNTLPSTGHAVATDVNGHAAMTGYYMGTVDFGNGQPITSDGGLDIFLAEYNVADGSTVSAQGFGGVYNDAGQGVAIDSGGNLLLTGYFEGSVNFGGGAIGSGTTLEVILAKYGSGTGSGSPVPSITSSLSASGTQNTAFSYQITASNSPTGYNATGLPAGLSVNTSTGVISGTATVSGTFSVTLSATNSAGTGNATLTLTINPSAPAITSSLSATGTVNAAFSYQITASNSPTSYNATGLPSGLSVNTSTGLISGTPTVNGTFSVTLSATNAGGTGTATLTLTINPAGSAPVITSSTSATGTINVAFSYQITANNSPTSFGATGLPAGLSINSSNGLISGTSTVTGSFSVNLSATNSHGTGSATLSLTINSNSGAPSITSSLTASGALGVAFSYQITATNNPTSYYVTNLPGGVSANTSTGLISGTPTTAGIYIVGLSASNASGTGTANLTLTISASGNAPVITSANTASGTVNAAFSYQIAATNSPTSFGATGMPTGVTVNTGTGLISGTPTVSGTFSVGLSAKNAIGSGTATLTLTINAVVAPPVITSGTTASGAVNTAFSYQISATNTPTGYGATGLPSGVGINGSTGLISGSPTASGTFTITLSATNSAGTGTAMLTLAISSAPPPPDFTISASPSHQTVKKGTIANYTVSIAGVNGFNGTVSFAMTSSPAGITDGFAPSTVTGSGSTTMSVTDSARGTYTLTITATSSTGTVHSTSVTLQVQN